MTPRYRLVYYTTDPFVGVRLPLGAVVQDGAGAIKATLNPTLPGPECVGPEAAALVRELAQDLQRIEAFDRLPRLFGPMLSLGAPVTLPEHVRDAVAWVNKLFQAPSRPEDKRAPRGQAPSRATVGMNALRSLNVERYVQPSFIPAKNGGASWRGASALQQITHWVGHDGEPSLLMEPIIPGLPKTAEEIRTVATRLGAYQSVISTRGLTAKLAVYITPGATDKELARITDGLGLFADAIWNLAEPGETRALTERVTSLGERSQPSLEI